MICRTDFQRRRRVLAGAALCAMFVGASALATTGQVQAARTAVERGDAIAADVALDRAEVAGATRRSITVLRGETCLLANDLFCAREWLGPGEFAEGEAARGFQLLGRLESRAGDPQAAAQAYDRALGIDNRNADLWIDIAEFRYSGREEALAGDALARALQLEPASARGLAMQARLFLQRGSMLASLPFFERAIDAAPDDAGLLVDYAAILGEAGYGGAFLAASRAAIEHGGSAQAFYLQALLTARSGDFATARTLMERVPRGYDRNGGEILRAVIDIEIGSVRTAQQSLERLYNRAPGDAVVARLYARALALGDRNTAIVSVFGSEANRYDADPYLKTAVARALERLGRRGEAGTLLDDAARSDAARFGPIAGVGSAVGAVAYGNAPYNFENVREYARGLIGEGQTAEAKSVAASFASSFPQSREARFLAGDTAMADGDYVAAIDHFERAAQTRYGGRLLLRMVVALERLGRRGDARRAAQSYLANRPGNALASRVVALQAADGGDWASARALLDYLLRSSGSRDVVLLALASQAAANLGESVEALRLAERAMELQPTNALAAASLSLAHQKSGMAKAEADRRAGLNRDGSRYPRALNRLLEATARGG